MARYYFKFHHCVAQYWGSRSPKYVWFVWNTEEVSGGDLQISSSLKTSPHHHRQNKSFNNLGYSSTFATFTISLYKFCHSVTKRNRVKLWKPCTQFPRRVLPGHFRSFQVRGAFCPVSFVQSLCAVIMSKRELLLKISFQFVALQVNQTTFCVVLKLPVFNDALSFPKSFRVGLHTFSLCSVSGILCRYDCNIGD